MRGLLLIDIQNDFLPGGALAVPRGDEVIAVASRLASSGAYGAIVATQDLHPADHGSFASQHAGKAPYAQGELAGLPQTLWPDHCVEGTRGAELADGIDRAGLAAIVPKGTDPTIDSYSGFFDNGHRQSTGLGEDLRARGVQEVYVLGLATDYCVKFTALDALQLGFRTRLVVDGCRAVNLAPGDDARAIDAMKAAGVEIVESADV